MKPLTPAQRVVLDALAAHPSGMLPITTSPEGVGRAAYTLCEFDQPLVEIGQFRGGRANYATITPHGRIARRVGATIPADELVLGDVFTQGTSDTLWMVVRYHADNRELEVVYRGQTVAMFRAVHFSERVVYRGRGELRLELTWPNRTATVIPLSK